MILLPPGTCSSAHLKKLISNFHSACFSLIIHKFGFISYLNSQTQVLVSQNLHNVNGNLYNGNVGMCVTTVFLCITFPKRIRIIRTGHCIQFCLTYRPNTLKNIQLNKKQIPKQALCFKYMDQSVYALNAIILSLWLSHFLKQLVFQFFQRHKVKQLLVIQASKLFKDRGVPCQSKRQKQPVWLLFYFVFHESMCLRYILSRK